jgi:KaiC/GvpD/RAD55 family RecA-like ATPase
MDKKKEKQEIKNYPLEIQENYLNFLMSDSVAFTRCQNILDVGHWNDRLKPAVRYLTTFADEYRALPTPEQVKAETGIQITKVDGIQEQHTEWFLKEIEGFCRHRAIENVVFDGADLITTGQYSELERRIKEAIVISLQRDLGTDYFADPKARIQAVLDRSDVMSTGWRDLDQKLYGGFTKGALNIFAGGSGSGKSLFLQNLALNWVFMGLDVIYITLELSENLVSTRLDAMVANVSTKDVFKKIDDVDLKVRMRGKQSGGSLTVKKMPEAGTSANVIRAYLKEYEIQTGRKPGALVVDYLDLMYPNNSKINPSDMFVKDKYVAEEMRALFSEYHVLSATASQLNRASVEAHEFDHSHIAGGISKINTADNVFGIFTSAAMRERGEYQIQFLKTRSSSAVGQRISLQFDSATLRITDVDEGEQMMQTRDLQSIGNDIKNKIKAGNVNSKGEVQREEKNDGEGEGTAQPRFAIPKPKPGHEIDNPNRPISDPRKAAGAASTVPAAAEAPKASAMRANMMDILKRVQRDH